MLEICEDVRSTGSDEGSITARLSSRNEHAFDEGDDVVAPDESGVASPVVSL